MKYRRNVTSFHIVRILGLLIAILLGGLVPVTLSVPGIASRITSNTLTQINQSPLARHVIIISIDGLRPDALQQAQTVSLKALWQGGAYSWEAQTVFPSITLPSHASMLSGVTILKHGIIWNDWEPDRGYIKVPTVLSLIHQAGLNTAGVVGKTKLEHLAPPSSIDFFSIPPSRAREIGQTAADYFKNHHPTVLFIHFPDPDGAGHSNGWMSAEQFEAIRDVDQHLNPLLTVLRESNLIDQTLIIISADHGGHARTHGTNQPEDMTIPWIASGSMIKQNHQIEAQIKTYDTAATVLYALGFPIPETWDGHPITEIFRSSQPMKK